MKRLLAAALLLLLPLAAAFGGQFVLDAGAGVTFEFGDTFGEETDYELLEGLELLLGMLTNLRVGVLLGFGVTADRPTVAGIEIGGFGYVGTNEEGESVLTPLLDIPARFFVRRAFGRFSLQIHAGYNFSTALDFAAANGLAMAHRLDFGIRFAGKTLYLEAHRLFWPGTDQSTRVGVGMILQNLFGRWRSDESSQDSE
jgi:hypothetical protein